MRVLVDKDTTNYNLRNAREQWLDKLRCKKIKLAKCEEKRSRKQDIMFQRHQKGFFRTLEGEEAHEEEMPEMQKFVEFWGGIWEREREREREERTPYMPWMEEIRRQLNEKVSQVKSEERGNREKRMDSTRHRRNTELLVEKARTSPKSINKGIYKNQGR